MHNFIESNEVIEINHPPYLSDLAPCDYWLFDYIKECLTSNQDTSLIKQITVNSIPKEEYKKTFKK